MKQSLNSKIKREKRYRRHKRVRAKIFGTADRPRLCVFRSAKHIYAQLIDDEKSQTLVSASDLEIKKPRTSKISIRGRQKTKIKKGNEKEQLTGKIAIAFEVGKLIAEKALKKTTTRPKLAPAKGGPLIEKVVFNRGGFAYHGRVKALADGARAGGLKF